MLLVRKAAVLGAGVMGGSIAAHLANCGIPTLLLDMCPAAPTPEEEASGLTIAAPEVRNRLALRAIEAAKKGGFADPSAQRLVTPGNFEDDLGALAGADWVIEAVVERMEIKGPLLARAAANLHPEALLTTNTSGLSVNALAERLPGELRPRFFGTHFFNPPRHMYLLEVIPSRWTDRATLDSFSEFAGRKVGKGVVEAKDAPNFIANRVGIFSTVYVFDAMTRHGLTIEEADAITGKPLGRAGSATFGTSDLAGIDLLANVVATQYEGAPGDESRELNRLPEWVAGMIAKGLHGNKAGAGFYKSRREFTIDPATLEYRPRREPDLPDVARAKKIPDPGARIASLVWSGEKAGEFAWDLTAATLLYAAHRVGEVCDAPLEIDRAMRWGFGWELGPFEIWEALGFERALARMRAEGRKIPAWVEEVAASGKSSFGEAARPGPRVIDLAGRKRAGAVIAECADATLVEIGDGVACLEFTTKMNTMNEGVMAFTRRAVDLAGRKFDALVVGNRGPVFSAGADLAVMRGHIASGGFKAIEGIIRDAQAGMAALKSCPVPVVAAPFGKVLGGGLEYALHCHRRQAYVETSMGLVELGVGLVPAAGGIIESILRALRLTGTTGVTSNATLLSAFEARELGFLCRADLVTINRDHLLFEAKTLALALVNCGFRTPVPAKILVAGRDGLAFLRANLANMREGGFITEYDLVLMGKVAFVLCGGEVESGSTVDEGYLFDLEREAFLSLAGEPRTLARIEHMLSTGKPLRN